MPFEVKIEGQNPMKVQLQGSIDENADLAGFFGRLQGAVRIDASEIQKINSIGIHKWVPLISEYSAKNPVEIERISYPFAVHASAILNLFGNSKLTSTLAPYTCEKCEQERLVPVSQKDLARTSSQVPEMTCPDCGDQMLFDELPQYFDFLKNPTR